MKKRTFRTTLAILGTLITLVCSVLPKYYVYASEPVQDQSVTSDDNIIQQLYNYFCTVSGAMDRTTAKIMGLPVTLENDIKSFLASAMNGGGIYVDENGDYVFTDDTLNGLYDRLSSNSSVDACVVSDFSQFNMFADGYVNSEYLAMVNSLIMHYKTGFATSDYMLISYRFIDSSLKNVVTCLTAYNLPSDFGYLSVMKDDRYTLRPINKNNGNKMGLTNGYVICTFNTENSQFSTRGSNDTGNNDLPKVYYSGSSFGYLNLYCNNGRLDNVDSSVVNSAYNSFPNYLDSNVWVRGSDNLPVTNLSVFCNNSIIFSKGSSAGMQYLNQTDGIYYDRVVNKVVNKTTLEENNWQEIYNKTINNINIEYQKDPTLSATDLRKIIKKYSDNVIQAIEEGTGDIQGEIEVSNDYLQAISVDTRNIIELLQEWYLHSQNGEGGGLTTEQYNNLMTAINTIQLNTDPQNYKIQQILNVLNSIDVDVEDVADINETLQGLTDGKEQYLNYLTYLSTCDNSLRSCYSELFSINSKLDSIYNKIPSRGGGNTITAPPLIGDDLIQQLMDLADGEIDDLQATLNIIGDVLSMCVPFCYLAVFGAMLEAFSVEPEKPEFEFTVSGGVLNNVSVAESIGDVTIENGQMTCKVDLSWVEPIRPYFIALEEIAFIVALMSVTFRIFRTFGAMFS